MAKIDRTKIDRKILAKKSNKVVDLKFPLTKNNLLIFALGFGVIILGYVLMSTGLSSEYAFEEGAWNSPIAISVAPFLLVVGYCVIIPYSIIKYFPISKSNSNTSQSDENSN